MTETDPTKWGLELSITVTVAVPDSPDDGLVRKTLNVDEVDVGEAVTAALLELMEYGGLPPDSATVTGVVQSDNTTVEGAVRIAGQFPAPSPRR